MEMDKDMTRRCINCIHFSRDFNRYFEREELERQETGYCQYAPPQRVVEQIDVSALKKEYISISPFVDEDSVCSKFEYNDPNKLTWEKIADIVRKEDKND